MIFISKLITYICQESILSISPSHQLFSIFSWHRSFVIHIFSVLFWSLHQGYQFIGHPQTAIPFYSCLKAYHFQNSDCFNLFSNFRFAQSLCSIQKFNQFSRLNYLSNFFFQQAINYFESWYFFSWMDFSFLWFQHYFLK